MKSIKLENKCINRGYTQIWQKIWSSGMTDILYFFYTFSSFNETKLTTSLNCTALWFNLNPLWNDYNTLVNIHLIQIEKKFVFLRVMRTQNLLSQQFSNISHGSANYSHQAAHCILEYESSYNWELVVLDHFHPKPVHPIPRLW